MKIPVRHWLEDCDRSSVEFELYSDKFLREFEASKFYLQCQAKVKGILSWYEWGECSVSCGGGVKLRMASECVPTYAFCKELQVQQESCNLVDCPPTPSSFVPPGTDLLQIQVLQINISLFCHCILSGSEYFIDKSV